MGFLITDANICVRKCLGVGMYYHIRDKQDMDRGCCGKCIAFSIIVGVTQRYYNNIQYYRINKIMIQPHDQRGCGLSAIYLCTYQYLNMIGCRFQQQ